MINNPTPLLFDRSKVVLHSDYVYYAPSVPSTTMAQPISPRHPPVQSEPPAATVPEPRSPPPTPPPISPAAQTPTPAAATPNSSRASVPGSVTTAYHPLIEMEAEESDAVEIPASVVSEERQPEMEDQAWERRIRRRFNF